MPFSPAHARMAAKSSVGPPASRRGCFLPAVCRAAAIQGAKLSRNASMLVWLRSISYPTPSMLKVIVPSAGRSGLRSSERVTVTF